MSEEVTINMAMKISIQLSSPIRFEKIQNGEKIIVQTSPDEYEVEVSDGEMKGESRIVQLHKLLDEGKKLMRKERDREKK